MVDYVAAFVYVLLLIAHAAARLRPGRWTQFGRQAQGDGIRPPDELRHTDAAVVIDLEAPLDRQGDEVKAPEGGRVGEGLGIIRVDTRRLNAERQCGELPG